jgi:hypothetical protein
VLVCHHVDVVLPAPETDLFDLSPGRPCHCERSEAIPDLLRGWGLLPLGCLAAGVAGATTKKLSLFE